MSHVFRRPRVYSFPYDDALFDARLDRFTEEAGARGSDIVFHLRTFRPTSAPEPLLVDGLPHELARGEYVPMRLRFLRGEWLWRTGPFESFEMLPPQHGARRMFGVLRSRQHVVGEFYLVSTDTLEPGTLGLRAHGAMLEHAPGAPESAELLRRWAATPSAPAGIVPHRPALYRRYGGDPITIRLGRRVLHHRLFIGGLHHQREVRPAVDAVLNLCGVENLWLGWQEPHPADRLICKGEGAAGMTPEDVLAEAEWVVERLRAGQRVLVHCFAGFNRSSTICCAALMLLEGISAEQALARVREHHPMAWPDPYHWFILRGLTQSAARLAVAPTGDGVSLLREASAIQ